MPNTDVSELLRAWGKGDLQARDDLPPLSIASYDSRPRASCVTNPPDTPSADRAVNEVYLKLVGQQRVTWQNRAHSWRRRADDAAGARRSTRARAAAKRPWRAFQVPLDDGIGATEPRSCDLLALDQALDEPHDVRSAPGADHRASVHLPA